MVDLWIRILLVVVIVAQIGSIGTAALNMRDPLATTGIMISPADKDGFLKAIGHGRDE